MAASTLVFLAPDSDVYFCFGDVRKTQWVYIGDYPHDYVSILPHYHEHCVDIGTGLLNLHFCSPIANSVFAASLQSGRVAAGQVRKTELIIRRTLLFVDVFFQRC